MFFIPIAAARPAGSIGAAYSAKPSMSSRDRPASSNAAAMALTAISWVFIGYDWPRLKSWVRPIPTIAVLSLSVMGWRLGGLKTGFQPKAQRAGGRRGGDEVLGVDPCE